MKLNKSFINDLKIINKVINKMFINKRYAYKIKFNEIKIRFSKNLKKFIFRDFYIKISSFAFK